MVAYLAGRSVDLIRRRVPVVACDVETRAALLDVEEADSIIGGIPRRGRGR